MRRRPPSRHRPGQPPAGISAERVFQITLALVLWYFLAGLVFSRVLGVWPEGFEAEGFFLTGAALPWSLLALGFYLPTESPSGAAVRDLLFFAVIAGGIAVNAVIVHGLLRSVLAQLRLRRQRRLRQSKQTSRDVADARSGARPRSEAPHRPSSPPPRR